MLETRQSLYRFYAIAPFVLFVLLRLPSFLFVLPNWSDIPLYKFFAESIVAGQTPYFDFKVEYPPLTLFFFALPGLIAKLLGGFETLYRLQMALFDLGCLILIGPLSHHIFKTDRKGVFVARLLYLALGAISFQVLYDRFDIAVAFLLTLSLYLALVKDRWILAYIALWIATLVKLFPAVLFPIFFITQMRQYKTPKRAASDFGYALLFLLVSLVVFQVMFGNWWDVVLGYHGKRGIQIESLYASAVLIAREFGLPAALNHEFGAYQLTNSFTGLMTLASPFILGAAILLFYYGFFRLTARPLDLARRKQGLVKGVLGLLLIFIALNKVLSPQYFLWLFPLVAVAINSRKGYMTALPLWILMAALTFILFPYNYVSLLTLQPLGVRLSIVRNILVAALTLITIYSLFHKPSE